MSPAPLFPIHVLPPQVRLAIKSIESQTRAPTAMIASSVFSALSLAAQAGYDVERSKGLRSPVSMYFVVVAASGERKTSVDTIVMKPLLDFQEEKKGIGRFIYSDITPFALLAKLNDFCRAAMLLESEAGRMFDSRLMKDIGFLNKLWGGESLPVDRHKFSFHVNSPRCTLLLMIQPGIFRGLMQRIGERLTNYGFLARCLICEPPTTQGKRFIFENNDIDISGYENFCVIIRRLLNEQAEFFSPGSAPLKKPRKIIKFDQYAQKAWISIYNGIEQNIGVHGVYHEHQDFASKMAENIARLAGLLHIFEGNVEDDIPEGTLLAAKEIVEWYAGEYMRIFSDDGSYDQIIEDAEKLKRFLTRTLQEKKINFHKRPDLLRFGPNSLRNAMRLDTTLLHMFQMGIIDVFQDTKFNAAQQISKTATIALKGIVQPPLRGPLTYVDASLTLTMDSFRPYGGN